MVEVIEFGSMFLLSRIKSVTDLTREVIMGVGEAKKRDILLARSSLRDFEIKPSEKKSDGRETFQLKINLRTFGFRSIHSPPEVGEIVLDGDCLHLCVIKPQSKIQNLPQLLGECLFLWQSLVRATFAKFSKQIWNRFCYLLRVLVEIL